MSALARQAPAEVKPRPNTMPQRTALRLLHTGALIRAGAGSWYCRAFPQQPVRNETVQTLALRGLARIENYRGLYEDRACCVITPEGMAAECGVRLAITAPPPVGPEVVLREVEDAIAVLTRDTDKLRAEMLRDSATVLQARRMLADIEARLASTERDLTRREEVRLSLAARRTDLRALVAHACERMTTELAEAGR